MFAPTTGGEQYVIITHRLWVKLRKRPFHHRPFIDGGRWAFTVRGVLPGDFNSLIDAYYFTKDIELRCLRAASGISADSPMVWNCPLRGWLSRAQMNFERCKHREGLGRPIDAACGRNTTQVARAC
jgi:hypothetical protein